jgi:hypothetical protein
MSENELRVGGAWRAFVVLVAVVAVVIYLS